MRKNEAAWLDKYQRWQIKVQKEGVRRTFTSSITGKKGKIDCEKKADKWLESGMIDVNIRFGKAYSEFLEYQKEFTSTANYKKHLSIGNIWLLPSLEHKKLSNITSMDYQNCLNAAYKKGRTKRTIRNIKGSITTFTTFCHRKRYETIQYLDIVIPKNAPNGSRTILQPDQLKMIFSLNEKASEYIYAFQFLIISGLRRGELCGLEKKDIYDGIVHISRSYTETCEFTQGKTENARRCFLLIPLAKDVLDKQCSLLKGKGLISSYVFPNANTGKVLHPKLLNKQWDEFRKSHNINCTLHELRHTFISITKGDVPEELLKMVVGHSKTMDTFGVYGHAVNGDIERAGKIINNTFERILR